MSDMKYEKITELIGETPLLKIPSSVHGLQNIDLYAKLEYMNPFGSVKDRIAKGMLLPILDTVKGKTVVEASSGNTAKALCGICGSEGIDFLTVTNRIKIPEVRMTLQLLGADIRELPGLSDCPDPMDPDDFTTVAANMANEQPEKYHYTDQYFNELNRSSHAQTGEEIARDLDKVDYFFGFLGTCGSSMGAGDVLKRERKTQVFGVVAAAGHHIPGGRNINELWEVGFFNKEYYADIIQGTTHEAIEGMIQLNRQCGILCGPTSGLTYSACVQKLSEVDAQLEERHVAVFIACDRVEPYMSYIRNARPELFSRTEARKTVEGQQASNVAAAPEIDPEEVLSDDSNIIIDLRGHFAYSTGHIPGSTNILGDVLAQIIEQGRVFPKGKRIIVVCPVGTISQKFAAFLKEQGYDAYSLRGGIMHWKEKNLPLESHMNSSTSE